MSGDTTPATTTAGVASGETDFRSPERSRAMSRSRERCKACPTNMALKHALAIADSKHCDHPGYCCWHGSEQPEPMYCDTYNVSASRKEPSNE